MLTNGEFSIGDFCVLLCLAKCKRNRTADGNRSDSMAGDVMPRISLSAIVNLYAIVTCLSNAAPFVLRANATWAILMTTNGSYLLQSQSPRGVTYVATNTSQFPGQACTLEEAQDVLSAGTKPVLVAAPWPFLAAMSVTHTLSR